MNDREKLSLTGPITKKSDVFWVWVTQLAPLLGVALAFFLAFKYGIGWMEIIVFLTMGTLGGIGVEVGFHRYFSHKSFKAVKPLSVVLVVLGSMTVMGPVFYWAHYHRRHHQHSDTEKDPHSPNDVYGDKSGFFKRLWFAHFGWNHSSRTVDETFELRGLFQISKDLAHFTESRAVIQAGRRYYFWVLLGILLPATICGLLHGTWYAFLSGALWGGLVRIAVGQHIVWGINSIAHTFGGRFFGTSDRSVNTQYVHLLFCIIGVFMILMTAAPEVKLWGSITFAFIFAMVTVGGGWHNNHHAFPNYAVQQYSWWQIDPFGWLILLWQRLGLASAATHPSRRKIRNYRAKNDTTS
jgi:stearoyl-CoA desaturase (delta-9 desaturase)